MIRSSTSYITAVSLFAAGLGACSSAAHVSPGVDADPALDAEAQHDGGAPDVQVADGSAITAGHWHTCAVDSVGTLKCWGNNYEGQLGNNSRGDSSMPVAVAGLTGLARVDGGSTHTCAVTSGGGVMCWGENNYGQLGTPHAIPRSLVPVDVSNLVGVTAVSGGALHSCAVTSAGGATCWGYNNSGQLGNNSNDSSRAPVDVFGLASGVSAVSSGGSFSCALTTAGAVHCWGFNGYGNLGNDSVLNSSVPVAVVGLSAGVARIAAGGTHACAMTTGGAVKCWGDNLYGQLGRTGNPHVPDEVAGLGAGVTAIASGRWHTCALLAGGGVKCWGLNDEGQLGDGSTLSLSVPVDVVGLGGGVTAIACGYRHTCALLDSGAVKCWGHNEDGQLGTGTTIDSTLPVDVIGL